MLRAALYARVSTEEQATEGASIAAQRKLLREYAGRGGMSVVAEFVDEGASARSADRPAFQQMVAAARRRPRPFDLILIHKTDRFARNREDAIVYKSLLRRECGVEVVSVAEQFEDSPTGKLLEGIMEVMAEFYSLNLSQEVKKGMREVAGQGKALGRPPFGYAIGDDGRLTVVPEEAAVVRWIFETYLAGATGLAGIVQRLRQDGPDRFGAAAARCRWSPAAVRNILSNPTYVGDLIWNRRDTSRQRCLRAPAEWIVTPPPHPPQRPPPPPRPPAGHLPTPPSSPATPWRRRQPCCTAAAAPGRPPPTTRCAAWSAASTAAAPWATSACSGAGPAASAASARTWPAPATSAPGPATSTTCPWRRWRTRCRPACSGF